MIYRIIYYNSILNTEVFHLLAREMTKTAEKIDIDMLRRAASHASGLLKALANPDRLLLLCQLSQSEYSVGELELLTGIQQPTLSQQLGVLRVGQLVTTRREGKQIFYSIASKEALAVLQVLYQQFCLSENGEKSD